MQLKEKIARIVFDARGSTEWTPEIGDKCGAAADAILAIPELRDALELLKAQRDMLFGGAGFVKIERVAPEEVYIKPPEPPQS